VVSGKAPTWLIAAVVVVLIIVVAGASMTMQMAKAGVSKAPQQKPTGAKAPEKQPAKPTEKKAEETKKPAAPSAGIKYDEAKAQEGLNYFKTIGCVACHSVSSLGVSGGAVGPDLSRVLLGNPGAAGSVIGRFFAENGLEDPAKDPEKAAQLLTQFLTNPPNYATTMKTQTNAYKAQFGDKWQKEIVPAIVEMFKKAASS